MRFTKNINITRDLIIKYGQTKGCYGCKFAVGEISYAKGHNENCRKRFMDMSEQPGFEELKSKMDKSIEKATRKYLETKQNEEESNRGKRSKTADTRSQSKQNVWGKMQGNGEQYLGR